MLSRSQEEKVKDSDTKGCRFEDAWDDYTYPNPYRLHRRKHSRVHRKKKGGREYQKATSPDVARCSHVPRSSLVADIIVWQKEKEASKGCDITFHEIMPRLCHVVKVREIFFCEHPTSIIACFEFSLNIELHICSVLSFSVYLEQVESRNSIPMASKTVASELSIIFKLQFMDTHFRWECLADKNLKNYNDVYHEVEHAESLYAEEEVSEDDAKYKSDLMSIKAAGLHKIAAKLEVFPCKDLFCKSLANCALERGILGSPTGNVVIISGLYSATTTDHVNQYWVPLLGEIIMNDRKPDLLEVLTFNLHANWAISKPGKDFFMASYVIDACCAYLEFNHPLFPAWPHPSNPPIHSITRDDMPRVSEAVRKDLKLIGAWWYFEEATIITMEGVLIPSTALPPYVPNRLVSLEVARQCNYGVNWPTLEKYARGIETMNLKARGVMRCWDPYDKVREHLRSIQDKAGLVYQHQNSEEDQFSLYLDKDVEIEEVETEETNGVLKQKLLSGLPIGLLEVQLPSTSIATTVSSLAPFTTSASGSGMFSPFTPPLSSLTTLLVPVPISSTPSSSTTLFSVIFTTSTFTSSSQSTSLTTEVVAIVSTASFPLLSLSTSSSLPSTTTVSRGEEVHRSQEMETTLPLDLSTGIRVSPFISLQPSLWSSPTFILPPPPVSLTSPLTISQSTLDTSAAIIISTPAFTPPTTNLPWEYQLRTLLTAIEAPVALGFSNPVFTTEESTMAFAIDSSTLSSTITTTTMLSAFDSPMSLQSEATTFSTPSTQVMSKQDWIQMQLDKVERMDTTTLRHPKVEEVKAKGNQVHHPVQSSLNWIGEWEAKLATLGNVARKNLLPNVPLLSLDEVVTCENVLAKSKQVLEDGDTPLVTSNSHLELSSQNILSLFSSGEFPQVMKQDNTLCTETKFEATLGNFANQFSRQLALVEEQGNQGHS
eukprot:Gb_34985 [translate_table: standard]